MREDITFVLEHHKEADATQIAEVLWLSQFLPKSKENKREKKTESPDKPTSNITTPKLPRDVSHRVVISKQKENSPKRDYSVIRNRDSSSTYSVNVAYQPTFFSIKEQFSSLIIKQKKLSTKEIDEVKSADYIANTGIFQPIFKSEKFYKAYFDLNILIDTNESMFLWQESIEHFVNELKLSIYFNRIRIFRFNSNQARVVFQNSTALKQERVLNLVFTDTVGKAWRNNQMFLLLDEFSKKSFTAIVSMLPKQMWQRTSLQEGESRFMKNRKFPPNNRSLRAEYPFIEQFIAKDSIKIPVIPYDESAFEYLCDIILATKGSLIETRIFEDLEQVELEESVESIDAQTRVKQFFNSAQPNAKELAIYCSVLPLNNEIIKEVIRHKELGDIDAFAEFYFGGLLDRSKRAKIGLYEFYDGVQKELLRYISMEVASELYMILSQVINQSLGVRFGMIELLYEVDGSEPLDEKERALAELLMRVLGEKGRFYQKDVKRLGGIIDTVYLETNSFLMGSEDGYGWEKPVHRVTFDYDFEIAKYPVTFDEYDLYCEDTGTRKVNDMGWGRGRRPVMNVSWYDTQRYCKWLSQKTGKEYRLPTEAEWEYVCRAGTTTKWSFGDNERDFDKYACRYSYTNNSKVGDKLANPWGLYGIHGYVWEWCEDDWVGNYNNIPKNGKKYEDSSSDRKVVRGGSWNYGTDDTRSAYRYTRTPTDSYYDGGFRLLRTLP